MYPISSLNPREFSVVVPVKTSTTMALKSGVIIPSPFFVHVLLFVILVL